MFLLVLGVDSEVGAGEGLQVVEPGLEVVGDFAVVWHAGYDGMGYKEG